MSDPKDGNTQKRVPNWKKFLVLNNTSVEASEINLKKGHKRKFVDNVVKEASQKRRALHKQTKGIKISSEDKEEREKISRTEEMKHAKNTLGNLEFLITQSEVNIPKELPTAAKIALLYLVEWKFCRSNWKFQKLRQIWLLKHVYDRDMFPDDFFKIFLDYIADLAGHARESTSKEAQAIVNEPEPEQINGNNDDDDETSISKTKFDRALEILRVLS
ncbi:11498_t:CDS:2 [Acaulospora morrowiae]|uniref:11498_t:CDS:1 n=1 Tax=Acaulospora morrowiae TaxID=94023 RepID=A0A9N9D9X4_9GLOM|nr:11498_t:CDS:2 [Acaulospora morrowiae]